MVRKCASVGNPTLTGFEETSVFPHDRVPDHQVSVNKSAIENRVNKFWITEGKGTGMSLCVQSYCQHFAYTLRAWFLYHCFVFVYFSVLVCLYPYVFNDVLPVPWCFSAIKISAIKSLCLYSSSVAIIEFNTQTCWNTDMAKWLRILQPILSLIQSMAYQYQWQCHSPATASRCIVPNQM